jgi:hypothetical protein
MPSYNKLANAFGMNIFELEDELDMTSGRGFTEKLMPMLNMFTQGKEQNDKGGRPQSSESELTESGATTRDAGSNIGRGGNI